MTEAACGTKGLLFVLSGPAGAGKGTLRKILFDELPGLFYSISCTTRPMRLGETDGADYHFITKDRFYELVREGAFLEWAEVHGNMYGTRRADVEECLGRGDDMVLEIDVNGSVAVKKEMPDAIRIFITALSLDTLYNRLEGRGTETVDQMMLRMRNAEVEMKFSDKFEHIIVNDDLETASKELLDIVRGYRSQRHNRGG
ncbi:MAG: guanylate kinase [Synergistaceae bacterium]|jgi:guanylate kinase|nr:guanylate kinase [Synergistaceae bacterium]